MKGHSVFKRSIRKLVLYLLKITSRDIVIKHQFTGYSFLLNIYHHKGYWYFGKRREKDSMKRFSEIIKPGMSVLEVGGHIGYLTSYYSFLVGDVGRVVVFEPGRNNLGYLYKNAGFCKFNNIDIEEYAAGNSNCSMTFYLDPITGQNNTLVKDFKGFEENRKLSAQPDSEFIDDTVNVIRLDDYLKERRLPDFIKIDVEGYEWECLEGLKETIERNRPLLMMEIQANSDKIFKYFVSINYRIFNDKLDKITTEKDYQEYGTPNIFLFP
jgi:FkbM family methyltransferase